MCSYDLQFVWSAECGNFKINMAARQELQCVVLASFLLLEEILDDEEIGFKEEEDVSAFLLLQASKSLRNTGVRIHGFAENTVPRYQNPRSELTSECAEVPQKG